MYADTPLSERLEQLIQGPAAGLMAQVDALDDLDLEEATLEALTALVRYQQAVAGVGQDGVALALSDLAQNLVRLPH
ncbi:MAG: hypothetical protein C4327_10865 [Meiothermus sp.]